MGIRFLIFFILVSFHLSCTKSSGSREQNQPVENSNQPGYTQNPEKTGQQNVIDGTFDRKAFADKIRQRVAQIPVIKEEKDRQMLSVNSEIIELRKNIDQQLNNVFSDLLIGPHELVNQSVQIIEGIEAEARQIFNNSFLSKYLDKDLVEEMILVTAMDEEDRAQKKAIDQMDKRIIHPVGQIVEDNVILVQKSVERFLGAFQLTDDQGISQLMSTNPEYERDITDKVRAALKKKYDRKSLGLIADYDKKISRLDEEPYQFQLITGSITGVYSLAPGRYIPSELETLLHRIINLYNELRNLNPYHEQGV